MKQICFSILKNPHFQRLRFISQWPFMFIIVQKLPYAVGCKLLKCLHGNLEIGTNMFMPSPDCRTLLTFKITANNVVRRYLNNGIIRPLGLFFILSFLSVGKSAGQNASHSKFLINKHAMLGSKNNTVGNLIYACTTVNVHFDPRVQIECSVFRVSTFNSSIY